MLNIFKINEIGSVEKYGELFSSLKISEPYFLLDYIEIFSGGFDDLICFSFSTGTGEHIVMLGYLRNIEPEGVDSQLYDFTAPYGYTGPLYSDGVTPDDKARFWKAVDQWYVENNVVTEFIRFNLSGNQIGYNGTVHPTMLNVKGAIIDEEAQWAAFDHKVRKNVKKAVRENLHSKVYYGDVTDEQILEFHKIYIETMERTNAKAHFFYSFAQFKKFLNNNKQYAAVCTVYFEETPVSSEFILVSEDTIYSFLGGTDEKFFDKRPNDFLKVEALNWARSIGKKYYVLGGGYGFEDGIFKYKKAFFPEGVVSYYTGRKVLNQEIYALLVHKASVHRQSLGFEKLDTSDTSYFPLYSKKTELKTQNV